jgi:hypothetical protein
MYHDEHGHLPPAYIADAQGRPMHSWRVLILPYLGLNDLYQQYDFCEPWDGPNNRELASQMPRTYAFPGYDKPGCTTTNYFAVVGQQTIWPGGDTTSFDEIKDGSAFTILLVENLGMEVHWMEPRDLSLAEMDFTINSPAGVSSIYDAPAVVMADAGVRRLGKNVTPRVLRALLTINGREDRADQDGERGVTVLPDGRNRPLAEP